MRRLQPRKPKNTNIPRSSFDFISQVKQFFSGFPFVLVVKGDSKARCVCYNDLEHSYNSKCQICAGTGWIPVIEKHRAYWQSSGRNSTQLPRLMDVQEPAVIESNTKMFYFYANAVLHESDTIVIAKFGNELPSYDTMEFYQVNHLEPKFDEHGNVIFIRAACERMLIDAQARTVAIYNLRNTIRTVEIPK